MTKKQAILYAADMVARSNASLEESLVRSNREYGEKLESISKAEIKSKDRVNISLEEYEYMKHRIESLDSEVHNLRSVLNKINIPLDKKIIPDTIRTYYCRDPLHFRHTFRVEFAIDETEF